MNPTDPLANLRDIHLPGDVSWWPLAPGWWVLIALLVVLLVWSISKWLRWRKRQFLLHEVKNELARIQSEFTHHQAVRQLISDSSQLLRRLLILQLGRDKGASLSGNEWRTHLSQFLNDHQAEEAYLDLLTDGQYRRNVILDQPDKFTDWVNKCALDLSRQIIAESSHA